MSGTNHGSALIVGAGPELGPALARHCIAAGMEVALAAREGARVAALADELGARPCSRDVAVAEAWHAGSVRSSPRRARSTRFAPLVRRLRSPP